MRTRDPRKEFWIQTTGFANEGRWASLFSLSNGYLGLRGVPEECPSSPAGGFYVAGAYASAPKELLGLHDPDHILVDPERLRAASQFTHDCLWTLPNLPFPIAVSFIVGGVPFHPETSKLLSYERVIEFDNAVLRRTTVFSDSPGRKTRVHSRRFVSMADRNLVCLEYTVTPLNHDAPIEVEGRIERNVANANGFVLWSEVGCVEKPGLAAVECVVRGSRAHVAIAQCGLRRNEGRSIILELFAVAGEMSLEDAIRRAGEAAEKGFTLNLDEHRNAFAAQHRAAMVQFDADIPTQQGFNFGQMHLHMAFPYGNNRVGLPIKGLTGEGYRFATFWDADFHMFPYYLLTKPKEARRLLEYRYNQLPAYRNNARLSGAEGAKVPWETQDSGAEATAPWLCLAEREIHVSGDAAGMFMLYDELTGDHSAMAEMGAEFILETARFYASRVRWVPERGRYELPGVACPDQYHTCVDNDFITNMTARWNIEYAIKIAGSGEYGSAAARIGLRAEEVKKWTEILAGFYAPAPNDDGVIEEFDGYFSLSPDMEGVSETYCAHSQAVKQPDVLAALVPFEDLFSLDVRRRNWLFYAQRTTHGSSLSHPGMAYAAARCGLNDEALYHLARAARIDLDDLNLDGERGVHISCFSVAWLAVVRGFGGLTAARDYLHFRPNLPRLWRYLRFPVHWRFQKVFVNLQRGRIGFEADPANTRSVIIKVRDEEPFELSPGSGKTVSLAPVAGTSVVSGRKYDLAFLGHMCYDEITPFQGETIIAPGSAVFCGALTAARLGRHVAAIVKMAPADDRMLDPMREAGVDVYVIPSAKTTYSRVVHDMPDLDLRRVSIVSNAGRIRLDEVPEIDATHLHLAGISDREFDMELLDGLVRRGYDLSIDMQSFVRQVNAETGEVSFGDVPDKGRIVQLMDKAKLDAVEAEVLTGTDDLEEAAKDLERFGCPEIVITRSDGMLVRAFGATFFERFSNQGAAGRTGRGDTAFGAYLARRMEDGVAASLKFAAALVSIKMETPGPFCGTVEEVLERVRRSHS